MANSSLQGESYPISDVILTKLKNALVKYGENERAKNLITQRRITYENAKRIKNFLENADKSSAEYELAGGAEMLTFLNRILKSKRHDEHRSKEIKSNYAGLSNVHKKSHTRDRGIASKPIAVPKMTENFTFIVNESVIQKIKEEITYLDSSNFSKRRNIKKDSSPNAGILVNYLYSVFLGKYRVFVGEDYNNVLSDFIEKLKNEYKQYGYDGNSEGLLKELLLKMPISSKINVSQYLDVNRTIEELKEKLNNYEKEMINLGKEYSSNSLHGFQYDGLNEKSEKEVKRRIIDILEIERKAIDRIKNNMVEKVFSESEMIEKIFDLTDLIFDNYLRLFRKFLVLSFAVGKHKS